MCEFWNNRWVCAIGWKQEARTTTSIYRCRWWQPFLCVSEVLFPHRRSFAMLCYFTTRSLYSSPLPLPSVYWRVVALFKWDCRVGAALRIAMSVIWAWSWWRWSWVGEPSMPSHILTHYLQWRLKDEISRLGGWMDERVLVNKSKSPPYMFKVDSFQFDFTILPFQGFWYFFQYWII